MRIRTLLVLLLAPACFAEARRAEAASQRPNILFLFSDDQRFDTIHALGNREIHTPNLDRLVHQGFAFRRAFIMGSMQGAVCVPSRAMLMTGRTLFHATATLPGGAIPADAAMWPETLRQHGYQTIGVGKWHNDRRSFNRAFADGRSIFFGGMSDQQRLPVFDYDRSGRYPPTNQHVRDMFSTELLAETAIGFLRAQRATPFCLYVAFTSPHDPRTPPERFRRRYDPDQLRVPKSFVPQHPFDNGEMKVRDEALLPWPRTPEAIQKEIAAYYGMISHLDEQIGRILATLEETGHARNTLIIFAGDNGLAVGRHGLLGKQNLYDHSIRVPLIFSGPGIPRGKHSDAFCYLLDVFPTLCDLALIPVPAGVEGRSLAGIIQGRERRVRDSVFAAYARVQRMIRDDEWKLIYYPHLERAQLFRIARDPDEVRDLSAEPKQATRLAEMRARLQAAQRAHDDPLVVGPRSPDPGKTRPRPGRTPRAGS